MEVVEISEKKKRAPNFHANEKTLLLNLISVYKNIIENKQTNAQTWKDKDQAWDKITSLFNSQNSENVFRTKETLKKFYDNIKKNVRKTVAEEKVEIKKTGGGKKKMSSEDSDMELCLSIINEKTIFGLQNPYDGDGAKDRQDKLFILDDCMNVSHDGILNKSQPSTSRTCNQVLNEHSYPTSDSTDVIIEEVDTSIPGTSLNTTPRADWSKIAASQLKQNVSENLKHSWTKRRRPVLKQPSNELTAEYVALGKAKLEFYVAEKENMSRRNEREEEIFKWKKRKLELDVKIRELELAEKQK